MHEKCLEQDVKCCIVGVPKSIDNDILLIDRCFGFETAVAEAKKALLAAKVEARSAYRYPPTPAEYLQFNEMEGLAVTIVQLHQSHRLFCSRKGL
jgi:hypothetical protein